MALSLSQDLDEAESELTQSLRAFSCPHALTSDDLLLHVVVEHGREVVDQFLNDHAATLAEQSPGLVAVASACREGVTFADCWHPAMGDIHAHLLGAQGDPRTALGAFVMHRHSQGVPGSWSLVLTTSARHFRFGRWRLPASDRFEVECGGSEMCVTLSGGRDLHFVRNDDWELLQGEAEHAPEIAISGARLRVLTPEFLSEGSAARLMKADAYEFDTSEAPGGRTEWCSAVEQALALLATTSPMHLAWTLRVVSELLPLRARQGTFNSGGERFSPGVVCLSDQADVWAISEMLVHEATHQYMQIIARLGPLDDGRDTRLHYSPFRGKGRPLFFILVAYHAFANVLLWYERAREAGQAPHFQGALKGLERRECTLYSQVRALEPALDDNPALTPLGRALYEPLRGLVQRMERPS